MTDDRDRSDLRDVRDLAIRTEQRVANAEANVHSLKGEVHTLRSEINGKIDELLEKVSNINLTLAKWIGAGGVVIFLGQIAINKFM